MNSELKKLSYWLAINKLTLNIDKCRGGKGVVAEEGVVDVLINS